MQLWEKILQLALLGSERTHLEPEVSDALRQYGLDPEDPIPSVILSGAATLHQLRKLQLTLIETHDTSLVLCSEEETADVLSGAAVGSLQQILSGNYRRALGEFVRLLVANRRLLPPEFLPDLIAAGLRDQALWQEIRPLLGRRGEWLIDQNPEWRFLCPKGDPQRWDVAGHQERVNILGGLRSRDPGKALALLGPLWDQIDYRAKLDFLSVLGTGLGIADEDFLERNLDDRRKEVRQKAADLLALLPESRLVGRIFQQLLPCFSLPSGKDGLKVQLPATLPTATVRDGIAPEVKKGKMGGLKVDWLAQGVSRIPPVCWMDHFSWDEEQLVAAFNSSDRSDLLLRALAQACVRFRDRHTAAVMISFLVLHGGRVPEGLDWSALVSLLPSAELNQLAARYWQQHSGLLDEQHLWTRILERGEHLWDAATAGRVVQDLKEWMTTSKTFLWNLWHYKRLLETAGYCSPVELLPELGADWPVHSPVWNQWAPDVERMLRIMRFRKEMARQLCGT